MPTEQRIECQPSMAAGTPFLCSWSGGKDCCTALYRALDMGAGPARLLAMLNDNGERCRAHGLTADVLEAQAAGMRLPVYIGRANRDDYETAFKEGLRRLAADGAEVAVFGDIDCYPHVEWEDRVCREIGLRLCHPIWDGDRRALLTEFLEAGFTTIIVSVHTDALDDTFLGRELDVDMIDEFAARGIDVCGENGEYHTLVVDGPLFTTPLAPHYDGVRAAGDYHLLDVRV